MANINLQQIPHTPTGVNAEIGLVGDAQKVSLTTALPAGTNNIGDVDIASALPAGTNKIGSVDIASALPAGTNNIGNVDIASALPAGANIIGLVKLTDGTDALAINTNGSINILPVDSTGTAFGTATNPFYQRSSGQLVTETSVVARSLRITSSDVTPVDVPTGAKGCIIYAANYGITGTFAAGEGLSLEVYVNTRLSLGVSLSHATMFTTKYAQTRNHVVVISTGAQKGDLTGSPDAGLLKVTGIPLGNQRISVRLNVNGTFTEGQGIDCEAVIQWLY